MGHQLLGWVEKMGKEDVQRVCMDMTIPSFVVVHGS